MDCSTPDCRRGGYRPLNFPGPDGTLVRVCGRHCTDEQRALVADLDARGARVGVEGGAWPYGPNVDVESRARLVDWAETTGYRLADPRRQCLHWVVGQARRCVALREYDHLGRIADDYFHALDHTTFWTRDGAPALILGQPYHHPDAEWVEQVTAEWPVAVEVTDTAPWYGHGTVGVLVHAAPERTGEVYPAPARPAAEVTWPAVADVLARHGGRPRIDHGHSRSWGVPAPGGGELWVTVELRPRWCTVVVDRPDAVPHRPDDAEAWLRAHVWPMVRRAADRTSGRRAAGLPTGYRWACADPVERGDVLALLDVWLPQEAAWTAGTSR